MKKYKLDKNGCIVLPTELQKKNEKQYEALKENLSNLLNTNHQHQSITLYKNFKFVHSGFFGQYIDPITKNIKSKEKIYIYDENDGKHYTNTNIFLAKKIVEKLKLEGKNAYIGDAAHMIINGNIIESNIPEDVGIYIEQNNLYQEKNKGNIKR